jgi:hypothetical protein
MIPNGAHAHHIFPQKFGDFFEAAGIDIHDAQYLEWWEAGSHLKNSAGYNKLWEQFFEAGPKSRDEILQFGRGRNYGFNVSF